MRSIQIPAKVLAFIVPFTAAGPLYAQTPAWQAGIAKVSVNQKLSRAPGAAFVVALDGQTAFLVTCAHVVEGDPNPRVEFLARPHRFFTAEARGLESGDNPRALAVLVVRDSPPELRPLPLAASAAPNVGDEVLVAGYPQPASLFLAPKTSVAGIEGQDLALSLETVKGFSGGPVMRGGAAIGITYGTVAGGYGVALVSDTVRTYLTGLKIPLPRDSPADSTDIRTPGAPRPGDTKVKDVAQQRYVWIPPGAFQMGCSTGDSDCDFDEEPAHRVVISNGYWMGQTEVTVAAYKRYVAQTGKRMPPEPRLAGAELNPGWKEDSQPIVNIWWEQAVAFCEWAGMRLPTEAEWEYAARAGSREARYGVLNDIAWSVDNSGTGNPDVSGIHYYAVGAEKYDKILALNRNGPKAVAQKLPNSWGLHDMLGNVWEWTADWYGEKYYEKREWRDPQGPASGYQRVVRGGSWHNPGSVLRASSRIGSDPQNWYIVQGFRCVGE